MSGDDFLFDLSSGFSLDHGETVAQGSSWLFGSSKGGKEDDSEPLTFDSLMASDNGPNFLDFSFDQPNLTSMEEEADKVGNGSEDEDSLTNTNEAQPDEAEEDANVVRLDDADHNMEDEVDKFRFCDYDDDSGVRKKAKISTFETRLVGDRISASDIFTLQSPEKPRSEFRASPRQTSPSSPGCVSQSDSCKPATNVVSPASFIDEKPNKRPSQKLEDKKRATFESTSVLDAPTLSQRIDAKFRCTPRSRALNATKGPRDGVDLERKENYAENPRKSPDGGLPRQNRVSTGDIVKRPRTETVTKRTLDSAKTVVRALEKRGQDRNSLIPSAVTVGGWGKTNTKSRIESSMGVKHSELASVIASSVSRLKSSTEYLATSRKELDDHLRTLQRLHALADKTIEKLEREKRGYLEATRKMQTALGTVRNPR